jgi:hypothetical protein
MKNYQDQTICFDYPDGWELYREDGPDEYAVSVEGPGTAMWIVNVNFKRPTADVLVEIAIDSLRSEYPTCDVYDAEERICLLPTTSKDVDFFKYELVSRACLRACETEIATILVIYQVSDNDAVEYEEYLKAMTDSLVYSPADDDDDGIPDVDVFKFDNLFGSHGADEDE